MIKTHKIGVFDSGVGGAGVAHAIQLALPDAEIMLCQDTQNVPYGTKTPELLLTLVKPILRTMADAGCQIIVIACNTVSTTIINQLRAEIPIPLLETVPMVKPAALLTKSKVIAVCATPTTLKSQRYNWLKETYTQGITVLEPDCSDWSILIETKQMDEQKIEVEIREVLDKNADVIVLGCTHYHWIENEIKAIAKGRAQVLQPEDAIIKRLRRTLAELA
jgi:glutamate racemase